MTFAEIPQCSAGCIVLFSASVYLFGLSVLYCVILDMHADDLIHRLLCSGVYVRKTKVSVDNVHLYGLPAVRMLTLCESLAYSRTHSVLPSKTSCKIYDQFSYSGLYLTSLTYKETNTNCDDTLQLTDGRFCSVACCAVGNFHVLVFSRVLVQKVWQFLLHL